MEDLQTYVRKIQERIDNSLDKVTLTLIKENIQHLINLEKMNRKDSQKLKELIQNQLVIYQINQIRSSCQEKLSLLFNKYNQTEDLKKWVHQNFTQNENQINSQFIVLVEQQPILEKSKEVLLNSINSFQCCLQQIVFTYLEALFTDLELMNDYKQFLIDLKTTVNQHILEEFKKKYNSHYKEYVYFVEKQLNEISYEYKKQVSFNFKTQIKNQIYQPLPNLFNELQYNLALIAQECERRIQQKFHITSSVFSYIFENELKVIQQQIQEYFWLSNRYSRYEIVNNLNPTFKYFMAHIQLKNIVDLFKFQHTKLKFNYIAAFFLQNIKIEAEFDRIILKQILRQLDHSLCNIIELHFLNEENAISLSQYQQQMEEAKVFTKQFYEKFINAMRRLQNEKEPIEFFKYLTLIYLLVTNVEVDCKRYKISFHPYYGQFYRIRVTILTDIQKHFEKAQQAPYFFNYLDTYFETYHISPFIQTEEQTSQSITINVENNDSFLEKQQRFNFINNSISKMNLKVEQIFYQEIERIQKEQNLKEKPAIMHLVRVSNKQTNSRSVIITISGFTSEETDKQQQWLDIASIYPNSEIYSIQYKNYTKKKFYMFNKAWQQAELTGLYLAHLIHEKCIFSTNSISFVGFSLGTQVITSFLAKYKQLIEKDGSPSLVASVCMLAGVADGNFIKQNNLISCISYKLFNCYSNQDIVLKFFKQIPYFLPNLIGQRPIEVNEKTDKIVNRDFSQFINGHREFQIHPSLVLSLIDFNQELLNPLQFPISSKL